MRRRRLWTGVVIGVAVFATSAAPAVAAGWAPAANGIVEICFKPKSGIDRVATQQAASAAATWNAASVNLRVTANVCGPNARIVMYGPGPSEGSVLGTTYWSTDGNGGGQSKSALDPEGGQDESEYEGHITKANIDFAVASINDWGKDTSNVAAAWRGVICHEFGHALSLPHSTDPNSCMQTGTSKPYALPAKTDFALLRKTYGGQANPKAIIPGLNSAQMAKLTGAKLVAPKAVAAPTVPQTQSNVNAIAPRTATQPGVVAQRPTTAAQPRVTTAPGTAAQSSNIRTVQGKVYAAPDPVPPTSNSSLTLRRPLVIDRVDVDHSSANLWRDDLVASINERAQQDYSLFPRFR